MGRHTIIGDFNVTLADLQVHNEKITSAEISPKKVVITANFMLTGERDELDELCSFLDTKKVQVRTIEERLSALEVK